MFTMQKKFPLLAMTTDRDPIYLNMDTMTVEGILTVPVGSFVSFSVDDNGDHEFNGCTFGHLSQSALYPKHAPYVFCTRRESNVRGVGSGGYGMHEDIKAEKVVETLYLEMINNITDEICLTCPFVRAVRELKDTIKDANHEKLIVELGLSFTNAKFPCMEKKA